MFRRLLLAALFACACADGDSASERNSVPTGGCALVIGAERIDFGAVGERATALRDLLLGNRGEATCTLRIEIEGDGAFRVPATLRLAPGEEAPLTVAVRPRSPGPVSATLRLRIEGRIAREIPLAAQVVERCIEAQEAVEFGPGPEGCRSAGAPVELHNRCDHPVSLLDVAFSPSTRDFRIGARPNLPARIPAGQAARIRIEQMPQWPGPVSASLVVTDDAGAETRIALRGKGLERAKARDFDRQGRRPDGDRLYLIDDGSDLAGLLAPWGEAVLGQLEAIDGQVGITATSRTPTEGCPGSGADGRLLPVDASAPRVLDRPELLDGRLPRRLEIPTCSAAPNEAFAVAERAITRLSRLHDDPDHPEPADGNVRLRRDGVPLQLVFVAARDDESPGRIADWIDRFAELQSLWNLGFAAILSGSDCGPIPLGHRIETLVRALGGTIHHLCDEPAPIEWTTTEPGWPFHTRYGLRWEPHDRDGDGQITEAGDGFLVRIDGEPMAQTGADGALRYRVSSQLFHVEFAPGSAPPEGALVELIYLPLCEESP